MTGEQLRKLRQELGWTQAELARVLGMTIKAIANLESGRYKIKQSLANHIHAEHKLWLIRRIMDSS
jgi:transcriptional regulator with XRE-family HTH domain